MHGPAVVGSSPWRRQMLFFQSLSTLVGWTILLAIAAYLIGALFIYAPFKVRRQQTKDLTAHYQPIELPELRPEVVQAFFDASRGLVACGFHALGHLTRYTQKTGQDSYVSIWV